MKKYTTIDKKFQSVIAKLENVVHRDEVTITARCPAHDDEHNSLSVSKGGDRILFKCFAGCSYKDIVTALGFKESDMFVRKSEGGASKGGVSLEEYAESKRLPVTWLREVFGLSTETAYGQKVVRIPYFNEDGDTVAVRLRLQLTGGNKFSWRKGAKIHPYGLNGLVKARELGYIILVEGESDTQTMWYHGIPALGIPGATTWRKDWAKYVAGLTVYVWKEPDGGGDSLVRSVARDIPNILVIAPEDNAKKDISEHHIAGDDVATVIKNLREKAVPFEDLLARETAEIIEESRRKASGLFDCVDILAELGGVLPRVGLVGEERNAKILYLALTSRVLGRLVSAIIKGPSSGGKSYLVKTVLQFFPKEAYIDVTNMSPHALVYDERPVKNKFIVLYEAEGLKDKNEDKNMFAYFLRSLLSEGRIEYAATVKTEGGMKVQHISKEGPTGLITTTTQVSLHQENETRMLSLTVRDDKEQTRNIFRAIAEQYTPRNTEEIDIEPWKAFQTWLELAGNRNVCIPYAKTLSELVSPDAVRLRRDFSHVLTLIEVHAFLHQRHRSVGADGYILATLDDYSAVYNLINPIISEGVEASVKETIRQTVEAVRVLNDEKKKLATVSDIARLLDIDKAAASRRIREAYDKGYLALHESSRGNRRKYIPGTPLPENKSILPTPEMLAAAWYGGHNPEDPTPTPGNLPPSNNGGGPQQQEQQQHEEEVVRTIKYPGEATVNNGAAAVTPGLVLPEPNIVWLETAQDIEEALRDIAQQQAVGLDVETTVKVVGKRGKKDIVKPDKLRLVQLATPDKVYMLDAFKTDVRQLAPLFTYENLVVVGHNIKFDLAMLRKAGLDAPGDVKLMDTMIASQLLSAGLEEAKPSKTKKTEKSKKKDGYHSLKNVVKRYLNQDIDKSLQESDWSGELTQEQIEYAARDVQVLLPLRLIMRVHLKKHDLVKAMTIEMEALPTVMLMEETGVYFNRDEWQPSVDEFTRERDDVERRLNELVGKPINWHSPKQILAVLNQRGHNVTSTDKYTLQRLSAEDPLALLLLEFRKVDHLVKTFGQAFLELVDSDGRVHPDFNQCGAATGRMSCQDPNLQQIPRKSNMRACFVAPEGRALVKADYSQIELRIAAEITRDKQMLEAYQTPGKDIHIMTAQLVMGRENVSDEDRRAAKAINFGLIYGMQPPTLRNYANMNYGANMTGEEANQFHAKFFETYEGIAFWHAMTKQKVRENGSVTTRTLAGRHRLEVKYPTEALNTPVQGTGADGLKAALGLLWKTRHKFPTARPILAVHDEIVVECDVHEAEAVKRWLVDCMKQGMQQFLKSVPVEVEATIAKDWAGKEKITTEGNHA